MLDFIVENWSAVFVLCRCVTMAAMCLWATLTWKIIQKKHWMRMGGYTLVIWDMLMIRDSSISLEELKVNAVFVKSIQSHEYLIN